MRRACLFLAAIGMLLGSSTAAELPAETRALARRVLDALEVMETAASGRAAALKPRSFVFSEAELNAYIAHRLDADKEPFVKNLALKLAAENRVEGRLVIDLGGQRTATLVPGRQELFFSARFETRDGRIRVDMDSLYLGTQPLSPLFIDVIIGIVSRLEGVKPTSLRDWYDLPTGVRRMETQPGRVTVFY